jgi:hypothetical protein
VKTRYTSRASGELNLAVAWYELQQQGLGLDFLDCVDASLARIRRSPEIYPIVQSALRRCVVDRFPFSIYFEIEKKEIVIHAIFDNRRDSRERP